MKKLTMPTKKAALWTTVTILGGAGIIGFLSHFFLGHDNFIEEHSERIIHEKTGIHLDMTPSSPERHL